MSHDLKLVISRMMSKGRTRQLASHDVSVAFFHAWLERGVWVKPPKDLRLSDDWLWHVVKALYGMRESTKAFQEVVREMYTTYGWTLLQTVPCLAYCGRLDSLAGWHGDDFYTESEPGALDEVDEMILASFKAKVLPRLGSGASTEGTISKRVLRSAEGVQMTPGAKHVENLASLLEVKGAKSSATPSSRATGRGQRDVLELLTVAEAKCSAEARGLLCISDQTGSICSLQRRSSLKTCRRQASKLSMLRLRRFVQYLFGAADVGPFIAYQDEPNTVLVWTDGDWSRNAVTCKSTSAGAVQLGATRLRRGV